MPLKVIASCALHYTLSVGESRKVSYALNGMYKFSKDLLECIDMFSALETGNSRVIKSREWKKEVFCAY